MFGRQLFGSVFLTIAVAAHVAAADPVWQIALLEDPEGHWSVEDVTTGQLATQFETVEKESINIGFSASTWWVRLSLDLPSNGRYLLAIDYTPNDRLTFFLPGNGNRKSIEAGDTYPARARPVAYSVPVFPLPAGYGGEVFLRVESRGAILLPLRIWEQQAFFEHAARSQFGYGLYYAFLLAMAIYNLFLFAGIRDRAYLWYVLFLGGLLLFQSNFTGHAAVWLWPGSPFWTNHATVFGVALMLAAGIQFVIHMAQTQFYSPRWHRLLQVITCLGILLPVLLLVDFRAGTIAATVLGAVALLLMPVPVILNYLRGCRSARFVLLGILAFFPGGILFVLRTLNLISATWLTEHALQVGTAAEVMLLAFALADRVNLLNREKDLAQRALLEVQDNERRRIARDLHDGLGQNLLLLANQIKRVTSHNGHTQELETLTRDSLHELRRIARNLYPNALDRLGLKAAIETMLEQTLIPAGIEFECEIEDIKLSRHSALQIFRIAQESVNNVLRHAAASTVLVRMVTNKDTFLLQIVDDGIGPPSRPATGFGLSGMHERANRIGGSLNIARRAGGGTEIKLQAPLHRITVPETSHD